MRRNNILHQGDDDPMGSVANLFDVAMVFAVALMVALVTRLGMTEILGSEDFTMIKNPGKDNMEIIGVNKSLAELEERRNLNALSAKKKSAKTNRAFQTAGALLSFGANTAVDLAMIDARNDRRERTKTKVEVNDAKTP